MAALDFPNSPTVGQTYAGTNGVSYQWDGTVWSVIVGTGTAAGGSLSGSYPNPSLAVKATIQTQQAGNVPANFSTATVGSWVTVVTSGSITTRGGVVLFFGWISGVISSSTAGGAIYFRVQRSGTTVSLWKYELVAAATNIRFPLGNIVAFDPGPAAGTYTYSFEVQQLANSPTFLTGGDNPGSIWAIELS